MCSGSMLDTGNAGTLRIFCFSLNLQSSCVADAIALLDKPFIVALCLKFCENMWWGRPGSS